MKKQFASILAVMILATSLLAGCGGQAARNEAPSDPPVAQSPPTAQTPPPSPPQAQNPPPSQEAPPPTSRQVTDMAGRVMDIPAVVDTVFSTGPVAAIYMYTLAPDMLLGWNYALNEIERSVILEQYHALPNFGMGDAINYEAVIAAGPSIALHIAAVNEGTIDQADKLAESLGIPVLLVSTALEDAPEVYRFLGEILGEESQAEKLAAYAERTFGDIDGTMIPEAEKVRIYYGNGEDSLETAPAGSSSGQIIDMVNAINAADVALGDGSRVRISLEQLLVWDPDVILVNGEPKVSLSGGSAANAIMSDKDFAILKAVQNQMVFGTPNAPFSWVDRPTGPNRIIGIRWLAKKIYPNYFDYDVDEEVREFFRLFYHTELTDEKLAEIYNGF